MQFLSGLTERGFRGKAKLLAIEGFVAQSSVPSALHRLGLDAEGILKSISSFKEEEETSREG